MENEPLVETAQDGLVGPGNLEKSANYFMNEGGQRIHVRRFLPINASECRAVVFWLHGLYGHISSCAQVELGMVMAGRGIAWITYDQAGHGYSEGERALIEDHKYLVEDAMRLVDTVVGAQQGVRVKNLGLSLEFLQRFKDVPFFIGGESMGGALAVITGVELQRKRKEATSSFPNFSGALLAAPAVEGNLPAAPIVWLLETCCLRCCPRSTVPEWIETVHKPEKVWVREDVRKMKEADSYDKGGLGWGKTTRLRTGFSMIQMLKDVQTCVHEVEFPFISLHDPGDEIVPFSGSKRLHDMSKTKPEDGVIQEMPGALHDLVTNKKETVNDLFYQWIKSRTTFLD